MSAATITYELYSTPLAATLSDPDLYVIVYDSTAACLGWGHVNHAHRIRKLIVD